MEICINCHFDNKSEFEKALNYLKPIVGGDINYSGQAFETEPNNWAIETYKPITQDQLNELTALCPIRPRVEVSKDAVRNKIAYMIGRFGASYHPEDDIRDLIDSDDFDEVQHFEIVQNDIDYICDALGLDPCAIALEIAASLYIIPDRLK